MENLKSMRKIVLVSNQVLAMGYNEIPFAPPVPKEDWPTKEQCRGFQFISMVQLCNIAEAKTSKRHTVYLAFGGDNGEKAVIPERQTWEAPHENKRWKYVLVSAVNAYFTEVGIEW